MDHPFINSLKSLTIYAGIWIVVMIIHFSVLTIYYQIPTLHALIDSFVSNLIFALLGLSIWYPVRYNKPSESNFANLIISHLTSLVIILLIWTGLCYFILNTIFQENKLYIDFLHKSVAWKAISGVFIYFIYVLIYYLVIYYDNLQEKLTTEIKLKEMLKEAELSLLKSQINPHFLFNSLNSISSLTITDPDKAQTMIIKLSDFLRYSISNPENKLSSFQLELQNIRLYLDIEQVRFGRRLQYENEISEPCLNQQIPVMILQPIYENAVKHGVYESTEPIIIKTFAEVKDNMLYIKIVNNFDPTAKSKKGTGTGLRNIKERLKLIYKNDQLLKTQKTEDTFEVQLIIPPLI